MERFKLYRMFRGGLWFLNGRGNWFLGYVDNDTHEQNLKMVWNTFEDYRKLTVSVAAVRISVFTVLAALMEWVV